MHTLDFHRLHIAIRDWILTHFQTTNPLVQTVMLLHFGPELRVLLNQGINAFAVLGKFVMDTMGFTEHS